MDKRRQRRWLYSGIGILAQRSLADRDDARILTNNPKDKEEWDEFDGEQDDHRVKCEAAVAECQQVRFGSTNGGELTVQAWRSKPSSSR